MFYLSKIVIFILVVGLMSGCVSVGRKIDQSAADKIEKGHTTKEQVVSLLGSPDRITRRSNGDAMFFYSYARATAKPATFIPIFGPLVGGANVQHQMLMISFGPDGIVKDFINSRGATESGTGLTTGSRALMPDVEEGKRPQ